MGREKNESDRSKRTAMQDLASAFSQGGDVIAGDIQPRKRAGASGDPLLETELSGQIVQQLRAAYGQLVETPVPSHLLDLLAKLSNVEDKS